MTEEELRAICKGCRERYPDGDFRGCPNYADVELVQHEQSQADRIAELQAYRATGLTVERAAELGKADREGECWCCRVRLEIQFMWLTLTNVHGLCVQLSIM